MLVYVAGKPRTFIRTVFLQMLLGKITSEFKSYCTTAPKKVDGCLTETLSFSNVTAENEWTFDLLYCVAFMVMDKQWLERNATYMEFNVRISLICIPFILPKIIHIRIMQGYICWSSNFIGF